MPEWLGINEYIYVKDIARSVGMICKSQNTSGVFNIGCGLLHTFDEFIAEIRKIAPDSKIIVAPSETPTVGYLLRDQPFDVTKAKKELGFQAQFSLQSGLTDYLNELSKWRGAYPRLD
jgi:UDP-glucose 4-epimerase